VNRFPTASTRAPLHNRLLIRLLRSRLRRIVDGSVVALRVRGVVTGSLCELPVVYAVDSTGYVVYPGRPDTKRWWRNLRHPAPVMLLRGGCWQTALGVLLRPTAPGYEGALRAYQQRWPRVTIRPGDPLVHVVCERAAPWFDEDAAGAAKLTSPTNAPVGSVRLTVQSVFLLTSQ
jgi:hypothetical protein